MAALSRLHSWLTSYVFMTRIREEEEEWTDLDETWVASFHHVPDISTMMRLPWQRPLISNGALNIQQLWASGGPILMKFGTRQQIGTKMTVT